MKASRPNILFVMTDEERYPPPYENEALTAYRRSHLVGREMIRDRAIQFDRHYTASTACIPSRASLFTGQYPSLHGVINTDGLTKSADDPDMFWLDRDTVPTMGSWFRACGYRTLYRGKWHISHPDLITPGTHRPIASNDRDGTTDAEAVRLYEQTDRLGGYGFSGWVGPEPHGGDPANAGIVRDPLFAQQVCDAFDRLEAGDDDSPWLLVASLVNPHDIAFSGGAWQIFGFPEPDDWVPSIPEAPSEGDSFDDRPTCHAEFAERWHEMLYPQEHDEAYRRFYMWLHELVDREIVRIMERLQSSRFADDTIVVFTSDHGDLLGAHGGMMQKWYNAFDEATRVPLLIAGPGIEPGGRVGAPTSHVDLLPTLLGLVGADSDAALKTLDASHTEAHELVGRDLSAVLRGQEDPSAVAEPVYFMTEDMMTEGLNQVSRITQEPFEAVSQPARVEMVVASLPTGADGDAELWKLNHYYDHLTDWEDEHGVSRDLGDPAGPTPSEWELYNLTTDPHERTNLAVGERPEAFDTALALLEREREAKRTLPRHR